MDLVPRSPVVAGMLPAARDLTGGSLRAAAASASRSSPGKAVNPGQRHHDDPDVEQQGNPDGVRQRLSNASVPTAISGSRCKNTYATASHPQMSRWSAPGTNWFTPWVSHEIADRNDDRSGTSWRSAGSG